MIIFNMIYNHFWVFGSSMVAQYFELVRPSHSVYYAGELLTAPADYNPTYKFFK